MIAALTGIKLRFGRGGRKWLNQSWACFWRRTGFNFPPSTCYTWLQCCLCHVGGRELAMAKDGIAKTKEE